MTAPAKLPAPDGLISVSHTEATLQARAMFAELRKMLPPHCDAAAELDNLVDRVTDLLWSADGTVDGASAAYTEATLRDVREELQTAEDERDQKEEEIKLLEARVDELEEAASDEPESLQAKHAAALAEIARLKGLQDRDKQRVAAGEALVRNVESLRSGVQYAFRQGRYVARKSKAAVAALESTEKTVNAAIDRAVQS